MREAFERAELAELASMHGATRVEVAPGVTAWRLPPWVCPHCGPEQPVQPGCPEPLAAHGTLAERERRAAEVFLAASARWHRHGALHCAGCDTVVHRSGVCATVIPADECSIPSTTWCPACRGSALL